MIEDTLHTLYIMMLRIFVRFPR